ncbi:MAG: SpoIIAA family protein, partial [Planctomycetota bacterium]
MLEYIVIPDTNIMEIVVDGKVTQEELKGAHDACDKLMADHDKIRMLKHVRSIGGIQASAMWDNLKFGFETMKHIDRVAVVADKKWIEIWTKM